MNRRVSNLLGNMTLAFILPCAALVSPPAAARLPLSGVVKVAAGDAHTCALTSAGAVKCWGKNDYGQLGDGTNVRDGAQFGRPVAVDVRGLETGIAAIAAGGASSCALTSAGGVKCWGRGPLGNIAIMQSLVPVDVTGMTSGVSAIAAGGSHVCALTAAGSVKCWGSNLEGQLGNIAITQSPVPVDVEGLTSGVAAIAAGRSHDCALTTAGAVRCWGANYYGQLGNGTTTQSLVPVDVAGLTSGVVALAAGGARTCALTAAGAVKCWGLGPLGDNSSAMSSTPVDVSGLGSGVAAIAAGGGGTMSFAGAPGIWGGDFSCALTAAGGVKCWGGNLMGQLGDNSTTDRLSPVQVSNLASDAVSIAAGGAHACAVMAGGAVKCWGAHDYGQLGDGSVNFASVPQDVVGLESGVAAIAAGNDQSCAVTSTGGIKCWGSNWLNKIDLGTMSDRLVPVDVPEFTSGMAGVAVGNVHTCALTASGGVKCRGDSQQGVLGGIPSTFPPTTAVDVTGLSSGVAAISAHWYHNCALTNAGGVKCWGANGSGQLGYVDSDSFRFGTSTPREVSGLGGGVTNIATGGATKIFAWILGFNPVSGRSCAVTSAGGAKCWGDNYGGGIGDNSTMDRGTPTDVAGLGSGVKAVSTGTGHTCALTSAGGVKCWGENLSGQLGDNSGSNRLVPADVAGLAGGVAAISAGRAHTCALTVEGAVKCWGANSSGQLGDGSVATRPAPVDVTGLATGARAIVAGEDHTCAITLPGGVKCWGANANGQLGTGTSRVRPFPVLAMERQAADIPRLGNVSTRVAVGTGDDVVIAGFVIGGTAPKTVVVRARGPSLAAFGIANTLANPMLQLFSGQLLIASNDDWQGASNAAQIRSSGFAPASATESAVLIALDPGAYTAVVTGADGGTGVGIVEVFEVDRLEIPLVNLSGRGFVSSASGVMITGFIIQGDSPRTVIVRARGPSLAQSGIGNALANPVLQLYSGTRLIAANDDWESAFDAGLIRNSRLAPSNSLESAIRLTLNPGAYTAIVTGAGGGTGVGIVEVFAQ